MERPGQGSYTENLGIRWGGRKSVHGAPFCQIMCDVQACGLSCTRGAGPCPVQPQAPLSGPELSAGNCLPGLNRRQCPLCLAACGTGAPGGAQVPAAAISVWAPKVNSETRIWVHAALSRRFQEARGAGSRVGSRFIKAVLMIRCYCLVTQSCPTLL